MLLNTLKFQAAPELRAVKGCEVFNWIAMGVGVIALGFIVLIAVLHMHLTRLRRDFLDLRAYLISILGNR